MTRISRSSSYALQVRADRRQAALDRAAERAATGTNDLIESKALHSSAARPATAFEKARAAAIAKTKERTPYTRVELEFLVNQYVKSGGDAVAARDAFMVAFPQTGHTAESVRACAGQLRALDNTCPTDTEWSIKSLVREVAGDLYPNRFDA